MARRPGCSRARGRKSLSPMLSTSVVRRPLPRSAARESWRRAITIRTCTSSDDWQAVIAYAVKTYGALNVLVNNAGTGTIATVKETSDQEWDGILDVHAKGMFLGCKHAIPALRASAAAR